MKSLILVFSLVLSLSASANEINLKPGQYKSTSKFWINGKLYDPAAELKKVMEQMPAEARAQMMKSMQAGQKEAQSSEHCLRKEDLTTKKIMQGIDDSDNCKHVVTKQSKNEILGTVTCAGGNKGTTIFKTTGNNQYSFEFNGTFNGQANTKLLSEGKFVSATCAKHLLEELENDDE